MPLWKNRDQANNAPKFEVLPGHNTAGMVRGNTAYHNTTPNAFINTITAGVYAVSTGEIALREANGVNHGVSPGWNLMKSGQGGVKSVTVTGGSNFATGETIKFSNGSVNGVATVTANATGNAVSATIVTPGLFTNAGIVVSAFNREKHLFNIVVTANASAIGFSNGDVITGANGITSAKATITTNATGGIASTNVTNVGMFANTAANNTVVFTIANSTGGATTGNTVAAIPNLAANLVASTGGTIGTPVMGGRAGRVQVETLAYMRVVANTTNTPPFANT